MRKVLVISNDSYGMNNVKVALKHEDIERTDLHDLLEMLVSEYPKVIIPKIDFLGNGILEVEQVYSEDYTEDYSLIFVNGGDEIYACRLNILEVEKSEIDLEVSKWKQ